MKYNLLLLSKDTEIINQIERYVSQQEDFILTAITEKKQLMNIHLKIDFIILDLDTMDFELALQLKLKNNSIIVLKTNPTVEDIVKHLEMGADDFLPKPLSVKELFARMKAIARRFKYVEEKLKLGNIELIIQEHAVKVKENKIHLSVKEFLLLKYLMLNKGIVIPASTLLQIIWGYNPDVIETKTLEVYIYRLREKIKPYQNYIETIHGVGYRFVIK